MTPNAPSSAPHEEFAERLKLAMRQAGYQSDSEIKAAFCNWFGISLEAARAWVLGTSLPKTSRIFDIASRCGVRADWLACGIGSPERDDDNHDSLIAQLHEARSANLRLWIDEDPVARGNVGAWCDRFSVHLQEGEKPFDPGHIRQYVPRKGRRHGNIGEHLARKIERAAGKPQGSLDAGAAVQGTPSTSELERALYAATPNQLAMVDVVLGLEPRAPLPREVQDLLRVAARLSGGS